MPRSIRSRVIGELQNLPFADDTLTAGQLSKALSVRSSSLSSILHRMVKKGEIVRVPDVGPRGGYGYRRKTVEEAIYESIQGGALKQLLEEQDREFFELTK